MGRHGPTLVHSLSHTHAHACTQLHKQEAPNHTPPSEIREHTHTGADTQEEGAAFAVLIKTVAAYLSLTLTRGTVKEKKHRKHCASQINTACCWGLDGAREAGVGVYLRV